MVMKPETDCNILSLLNCRSPLDADNIMELFPLLVFIVAINGRAGWDTFLVLREVMVDDAKMYGMIVNPMKAVLALGLVSNRDFCVSPDDIQLGLLPSVARNGHVICDHKIYSC